MKQENQGDSIYNFKDKTIEEQPIDFANYRNKVLLLVNTACKCNLARGGYEVIKEAKKRYPQLEVLLFPSVLNSLINQEEKKEKEIIKSLKDAGVYDISTVFAKRNATDSGPFQWVCDKARGTFGLAAPKWNFTKFLVSKDGTKVARFSPTSDYSAFEPTLKEYFAQ